MGEDGGIPSVEVKFVDIGRTPVAKAAIWTIPDADARKRGEQTGLDTLVVHAVNDACWTLEGIALQCRS